MSEYRDWSEVMLTMFFNDEDTDVGREASSCFNNLREEPLDTYKDLIIAFCDSRAFQNESFWIFNALEETRLRLPGTTCLVCEKYLDRFAEETRTHETSRYGGAHNVAKLIFRTYQQHQDDKWTTRLLDLIDRLCLERIYDARSEFEQYER